MFDDESESDDGTEATFTSNTTDVHAYAAYVNAAAASASLPSTSAEPESVETASKTQSETPDVTPRNDARPPGSAPQVKDQSNHKGKKKFQKFQKNPPKKVEQQPDPDAPKKIAPDRHFMATIEFGRKSVLTAAESKRLLGMHLNLQEKGVFIYKDNKKNYDELQAVLTKEHDQVDLLVRRYYSGLWDSDITSCPFNRRPSCATQYVMEIGRWRCNAPRVDALLSTEYSVFKKFGVEDLDTDPDAKTLELAWKRTLLEMGTLPKIMPPNMKSRAGVPIEYETVLERYNPQTHRERWSMLDDQNAPGLAQPNKMNVIIPACTLSRLLVPISQLDVLNVPFTVSEAYTSGMRSKVVTFDKPLPRNRATNRVATETFYKYALKCLLVRPKHDTSKVEAYRKMAARAKAKRKAEEEEASPGRPPLTPKSPPAEGVLSPKSPPAQPAKVAPEVESPSRDRDPLAPPPAKMGKPDDNRSVRQRLMDDEISSFGTFSARPDRVDPADVLPVLPTGLVPKAEPTPVTVKPEPGELPVPDDIPTVQDLTAGAAPSVKSEPEAILSPTKMEPPSPGSSSDEDALMIDDSEMSRSQNPVKDEPQDQTTAADALAANGSSWSQNSVKDEPQDQSTVVEDGAAADGPSGSLNPVKDEPEDETATAHSVAANGSSRSPTDPIKKESDQSPAPDPVMANGTAPAKEEAQVLPDFNPLSILNDLQSFSNEPSDVPDIQGPSSGKEGSAQAAASFLLNAKMPPDSENCRVSYDHWKFAGYDILVRSKLEGRLNLPNEPTATFAAKVDYVCEFGAQTIPQSEKLQLWTRCLLKKAKVLFLARMHPYTGEILCYRILPLKKVEDEVHRDTILNGFASLKSILNEVFDLPLGNYVLHHDAFASELSVLKPAKPVKPDKSQLDPSSENPKSEGPPPPGSEIPVKTEEPVIATAGLEKSVKTEEPGPAVPINLKFDVSITRDPGPFYKFCNINLDFDAHYRPIDPTVVFQRHRIFHRYPATFDLREENEIPDIMVDKTKSAALPVVKAHYYDPYTKDVVFARCSCKPMGRSRGGAYKKHKNPNRKYKPWQGGEVPRPTHPGGVASRPQGPGQGTMAVPRPQGHQKFHPRGRPMGPRAPAPGHGSMSAVPPPSMPPGRTLVVYKDFDIPTE